MSPAAFSIVFSLDREQSPKPSLDSPLSNLAIMPTPIGNGLRTRAESQPDDNCARSNCKSIFAPSVTSDAPSLGNSPQGSETSATPPIQPNLQDQVQYTLGASLEKEEEFKTIPPVQQPNPCDDFNTAIIQILCEPGGKQQIRKEAIALLDTASDCNMISCNMVTSYLCMSDYIQVQDEKSAIPIMTLNGDEVTPHGKIELRFYGSGGMNRRTYLEPFQVINGDVPWEIIIGKEFLKKWGIYKRFGLVGIHPRKTEGGVFSFPKFVLRSFSQLLIALLRIAELREAPDRRQKHEAEKAENARLVREQERKERASSPSAQPQRNGTASHPSQNQDRP